MLEYQAAAESASRIAQQITTAFPSSNYVIATNADVAALVQLHVVLGQARYIESRLAYLTSNITPDRFPCYSTIKTPKKQNIRSGRRPNDNTLGANAFLPGLFGPGGFIPGPADLQTLLQTIASVGSVSETVTPNAGGLADTSLINLVAAHLPHAFVPSVYPPDLFSATGLERSLLGRELQNLDMRRNLLYRATDVRLGAKNCQDPAAKGVVATLVAEVTAASNLVDSFEASLYSGQAYTPPASTTTSTSTAATSTAPATNTTATTTSPASGQQVAASAGALQALLSADALLQRIQQLGPGNTVLVTLHSLESGGNVLARSNLFLGSRQYFSGGMVATFNLYRDDGTTICSGISYGYRGFVQAKDIGMAAVYAAPVPGSDSQVAATAYNDSGEVLPLVTNFTSTCPSAPLPAHRP